MLRKKIGRLGNVKRNQQKKNQNKKRNIHGIKRRDGNNERSKEWGGLSRLSEQRMRLVQPKSRVESLSHRHLI